MLKNIRKYGWWAATLTMYVAVLVAYVSPLPGWVWFLGGVAFMVLWVKAEAVADKNAAKELASKKESQKTGDDIVLGEYDYPVNVYPRLLRDYGSEDESRLREAILKEMEEALAEDEAPVEAI
ncbi:MAG: hypothetical protein HN736_03630 [Anaerolineae bacterium]|jgi:hypothetical protein|nr:hypothetical protein [Anaerolineae bacterium]MBT4309903.1 hypothetical protein [Anaerolineae bacterium]MBT4460064.1 hypothetical protein [Anaerolineae bacterium]MBT4843653.1 hypothetical protein [Anaerolineae bacterium]MBT6060809.1 hypothetical protein [Anaerolineae bacterium]